MAKESCALCGKMVGGLNKMTLADGNVICIDCWSIAKPGIGVKPKQFTLESFREHLATNERSLAAQEKRIQKEERRELNAAAAQVKKERKFNDKLDKLGLNLDEYNTEQLRARNYDDIEQMAATLLGSKFYSFGTMLQGNPAEVFATEMARVQVSQNMMLIRQNEEIIRILKDLKNKE